MEIVAIIPARGGSKGLEKKNLLTFSGMPLVAHSIEQSLGSRWIGRTYVSTDDMEIAEVSKQYGAEVVIRPAEISGDSATSESALLHFLSHLQQAGCREPDYVVFLQCTSPLRKPEDIDLALETMMSQEADSLLSVVRSHQFMWRCEDDGLKAVNYNYMNRPRRQTFDSQYAENGSIYIFKPRILTQFRNRLGGKIAIHVMENWQAFEIDSVADFKLCQWLYDEYLTKGQVVRIVKEDIELIVYDFDGVMTDNLTYIDQTGCEMVRVNRSDGLAVSRIKNERIPQLILSTETNQVVRKRAEKLGIPVHFGVSDKKKFLQEYSSKANIDLRKVIYIGNDTNDLEVMKIVGIPIAPADAHEEVRRVAVLAMHSRGGEGVIRELLDLFVRKDVRNGNEQDVQFQGMARSGHKKQG